MMGSLVRPFRFSPRVRRPGVEDRAIGFPADNRVAAPTPLTSDGLCQTYAGRTRVIRVGDPLSTGRV